jgi:hypothetical protein
MFFQKLALSFNPERAIWSHFRKRQAAALDRAIQEERSDSSVPYVEYIEQF